MHSDKSKIINNIQQNDEEIDLLVAVATLVIEGRIPGTGPNFGEKSKDFHEGPHCNQLIARGNQKHFCELQNHLCEQFRINREIIAKHFNNNNNKKSSTFCIEVFFNCLCSKKIINSNTNFEEKSVLLEQWHFSTSSLLSKNISSSANQNFNINQLINAIRSQLYFSQLTAWLVTQDPESRIISENIHYRFCTPETLSGSLTFSLTATKHEFPNADLIKNNNDGRVLKVSFLSASRFPSKPIFHCSHHSEEEETEENKNMNLLDDRMPNFCKVKGKHHCCDSDDDDDDDDHHHHRVDEEAETKKKLKTPQKNDVLVVVNKGQLLLDAIERCGRNECDKKNLTYCDNNTINIMNSKNMMMNDGSFQKINNNIIIKKHNNNNNNNNHQKYNNILPSNGVKKKLLFENDFFEKNRRNLGNSTSALGLPLSSSPAPVRRGHKNCFEFDSSLNSVSAIKNALFSNSFSTDEESSENEGLISPCSPSELYHQKSKIKDNFPNLYRRKGRPTNLLGSFEESVLNGRLEPVSTVYGFTAELGASGSFVPEHISVPVVTFFYSFGQNDKVSTPYLGHIRLGKKGYNVPKQGTVQITLFNPLGTVVKMFVLPYDLTDMPISSQTFIRQRIFYMPTKNDKGILEDEDILPQPKWLRFLIHVRFMTSKSGKIYLHSDIRMIIVKKSDMDTATAHDIDRNYELRSFLQIPTNPRFSSRK